MMKPECAESVMVTLLTSPMRGRGYSTPTSLVTTPFLPERPGIYCLRMRVIRARVVHHIMRNDVYGRAWL